MGYEQLLSDLGGALERGEVNAVDVERLLRRRVMAATRPDLAGVLRALGAITVFAGAALLYGISFSSMPASLQSTSPLIFPLVALGAAVALHRAGRPAWEVELAGVVGYVAAGLALITIGWSVGGSARYGMLAAAGATVAVLVMHRLLGIVRLTGWGLSGSLVAFVTSGAVASGTFQDHSALVFLAQAAAAAVAGLVLLERSPDGAAAAWRTAALLGYAACIAGISQGHAWESVGPWHALLTLVVIATFAAAVLRDLPGLVWTGAIGGVVWLVALCAAVGDSSGWAFAVVVFGAGLVALGLLVGRFTRRRDNAAYLSAL